MSTFGDVVYCKDCDIARAEPAQEAVAGDGSPPVQPARRMAIKKDANGDPLCRACLDARVEKRRALFLLHEGRAPLPVSRTTESTAEPAKRLEIVPRHREADSKPRPEPAPPKRADKVSARTKRPSREASRPVAVRVSKQEVRAKEKRFAMLAVEIGFLRAKQLLGALMTAGRR